MAFSARRISQAVRLGAPIYYGGLRALGVPAVNRRLHDAGLILCYHNVVATDAPAYGDPGLHMSCDRFQAQMRWIAGHYTVVTLHEFVDRVTRGKSLRSVATVTFDDGYAGVFEYAIPVLRALGLPAMVFIVAEAIGFGGGFWWDRPEIVASISPEQRQIWLTTLRGDETAIGRRNWTADDRGGVPASHRPAGWNTIRAHIGGGIEIGAHSATHRTLPTLSDRELEHEVVTARELTHRALGIRPEYFAYPYGVWDARARARVRSAGYRAGLTLDHGLNRPFADPCSLRRLNVPAGISAAAFESWTAGLAGRRRS